MQRTHPSFEWLIVGGGLHGVHLAARLIGEAGIDPSRLRILDPGEELLARWRRCTRATGMEHLRSPGVHHLDLEPFSLTRLAGQRRHRRRGILKPPYSRPSLDLFDDHCNRVIERFGLRGLHLRAAAEHCEPGDAGVRIETSDGGSLDASRVVLALGVSEQPAWPDWAPRDDPRIRHLFARGFLWPDEDSPEPCLVVGGGISAAQVALRLVREGRPVHLVSRHPLRVHAFDSDPGWLGPKLMPLFRRERDYDERRRLLQKARHRGSVTPEIYRALKRTMQDGRLSFHQTSVQGLDIVKGDLRLDLADGQQLAGRHLLLATGFETRRPGGAVIHQLIDRAGLPCANCGYPVVDSWLRWHPRIHVSGPLAELELGPVARNIAGARRAGDRLVDGLRSAAIPTSTSFATDQGEDL